MIKINREKVPLVLKISPQKGTHYNKKKVVAALWRMQKEKCCYCEQKISAEGHSKAVEHFQPKSIFKFLKNDWENLLLACAQCNGSKSDKFPVELTDDNNNPKVVFLKKTTPKKKGKKLLIDPSEPDIDPEDHIDFIVDDSNFEELGIPKEKKGSKEGRITIDIVNLQSWYYTNKRRTFLLQTLLPAYHSLLHAYHLQQPDIVMNYKDRFRMYMTVNQEFAAVARAFCRTKNLDKNPFNIPIPKGFN
jgi:uncharacterized protein (TIGR02646 family)